MLSIFTAIHCAGGGNGFDISIETRTGDTPAHKRQRQKPAPPDILLTTPEQLALLIASRVAEQFFKDLRYVVLDELHSPAISKRGHLLALGLARLRRLQPQFADHRSFRHRGGAG